MFCFAGLVMSSVVVVVIVVVVVAVHNVTFLIFKATAQLTADTTTGYLETFSNDNLLTITSYPGDVYLDKNRHEMYFQLLFDLDLVFFPYFMTHILCSEYT